VRALLGAPIIFSPFQAVQKVLDLGNNMYTN
jgi:hypothetical protein